MFEKLLDNLFDKCCKCGKSSGVVKLYPVDSNNCREWICGKCMIKANKPTRKKAKLGTGWNELVTPKNLKQFVGQDTIKSELNTMFEANKQTRIPVQHVLFSGSFGLGKTTLAKLFAEMVGTYSYTTAVNIRDARDFPTTKVVVVDEIHTIASEEWLLSIMDKSGQTVIGATTTAGSLSGPLRSRFVSLVLQPYTVEELQIIVKGAAKNIKYDCPDYISYAIATRGKTVARVALFLFKRIYDRIVLEKAVTPELLRGWFAEMKIDPDGLDNADRAYLGCLSSKPIGVQNLTAMTGMDRITLEETIEPFLLTHGFVQRTARGRILGDRKVIKVWS
jgi:Holliday junction DNA helicase RuvB